MDEKDFELADVGVQRFFNMYHIFHKPDHTYFDAKKLK